jgi:two-component system, sporulation sensor kinase A
LAAIIKETNYVQGFLDHLSDAVLVFTPHLAFVTANDRFMELVGDTDLKAGQNIEDFLIRHHKGKEGTLKTSKGYISVKIKEGKLPFMEEDYRYFIVEEQPSAIQSCQESMLKTLMNIVPDFIGIKDGKGQFIFANKFVGELFELGDLNLIGKTDADLAVIKPFFREVFEYCIETDEQVWQAKKIVRCEEFVPARDGNTRFFDVYKIPVFNPDGSRKNLLVFGREVTEKIKSRVLLEESEARYRLLAENAMDMITTQTTKETFTYVSPASMALLGRKQEELIGQKSDRLIHPEDRAAVSKGHSLLMQQPHSMTIQFRLKHKEGHYVWLEASYKSIADETGNVYEVIGVMRDISDRKKSEALLRQSDKLSIVGQLAASVAHEIRNPLTSLKGFIHLFQENDQKDASSYYDIMEKELNRIDQFMNQLLLLAKPQAKIYKKTSLCELVDFVETLLQPEANAKNIQIRTEIDRNLPSMIAEENELKQVLINVIKNALDAMTDGGIVRVEGSLKDNKIVMLVHDQGCGISADHLEKIGEPFYTTKEKGTGLGLMVSSKIMKEHGGELQIQSAAGAGTTVILTFPLPLKEN